MDLFYGPFVSVQMGQADRRRGRCRPKVRHDNSGSQQSCVHGRTIRPSQRCGSDFLCEGHVYQNEKKNQQKNTSSDEPKHHIVISGKRNIVGVDDKTDMSVDYNKFHEIPPFTVKTDPSILLNDEDSPWLRRRRKQKQ